MRKAKWYLLIGLSLFLVGCQEASVVKESKETTSPAAIGADTSKERVNQESLKVTSIGSVQLSILEGKSAATLLAKEDDYTSKLTMFDYQSKFKVDKILTEEERFSSYQNEVLSWTEEEKTLLKQVIDSVSEKIEALDLNLPAEIYIIKSNGHVEAGAAYTRANAIILPEEMMVYGKDNPEDFAKLFVHELFHVYSRHNIDLRPSLYSVIHYKPCEELQFPAELDDMRISNPDAPDNNYYIETKYKGKDMKFIPYLYADRPYDKLKGEPFFMYLRDDMIAVEIKGKTPQIILENKKPIIVSKDELPDYYKLIGENTNYTYHPEETMADNFVLLVMGGEVPSPWVVEGLEKNLK